MWVIKQLHFDHQLHEEVSLMRLDRFLTDVSVLCLKWQFDGCKIRLLSTLESS